jgi:hypothetical protein
MRTKQQDGPLGKGFPIRSPLLGGLGLFLLAFVTRLIGIGWGLPDSMHHSSFHPDEWLILLASYYNMNPLQGDFLPGFYNYGSLPLTLWSVWLHLLIPGASSSVEAIASLHLMARILTALMGALTATVVFQTGRHLGGMGVGIVAGLVMAIAPAHVVHSRFQTVDVPTTLFVALTCLFAVRLYETPNLLKTLLWGAFWAGCAAGSKYNAGLVLIALWVSLWLRMRSESSGFKSLTFYVGLSVIVAVLTFLLACPGAWLESDAFWKNFLYEVRHVQAGHGDIFTDTGLGWVYHLWNLVQGFGFLALLLSTAGWILGWKPFPAARGILIAASAYYLLIGSAEVRFLRYTFPLYPALALGMGLFVTRLNSLDMKPVANRRWTLSLIVAVIMAVQGIHAVGYTYCMTGIDTRIQCVNWFQRNVPEGESIAFATVPWFYTPPFFPDTGELRWQDRLERMQQAQFPYPLLCLAPPDWNRERLASEMPDYLVISEFEYGDAERLQRQDYERFMTVVQSDYRLIQTFINHPKPYHKSGLPPHDLLYIYPDIRVYKRKTSKND